SAHGVTFFVKRYAMALRSITDGRCSRARGFAWAAACAGLLASGCGDDPVSVETSVTELSPEEEANVQVATRVIEDGLVGGDVAVIEALVRPDYIQHNAQARDGREG